MDFERLGGTRRKRGKNQVSVRDSERGEGEVCGTLTRDSEIKLEGLIQRKPGGQGPGWPDRGGNATGVSRREGLHPGSCTEHGPVPLLSTTPLHHLPGKQGKDYSKVTRSHLGSSLLPWLAGLSALRSGLFWELHSQNNPTPAPHSPFRGQRLLTMTFSQGIVSLMSLLLGTSPNSLRASYVWDMPSATWVLGSGSPLQGPICHPHLHKLSFPMAGVMVRCLSILHTKCGIVGQAMTAAQHAASLMPQGPGV